MFYLWEVKIELRKILYIIFLPRISSVYFPHFGSTVRLLIYESVGREFSQKTSTFDNCSPRNFLRAICLGYVFLITYFYFPPV